jgi:hypothetical protein
MKPLTAFSSERGCKGWQHTRGRGTMDQHEGEPQRSGVRAPAHARRLGPLQKVRMIAAVLRALTERS